MVDCSSDFEKLLKRPPEGGTSYIKYLDAEAGGSSAASAEVKECLLHKTSGSNLRLNLKTPAGTPRGSHVLQVCPIKDLGGEVRFFVCIHADMTKDAEAVTKAIQAGLEAKERKDEAVAAKVAAAGPLAKAAIAYREQSRVKAMNLLEDQNATYDDNHGLMLCRLYDFGKGLLFLLEKLQFYSDILGYYMEFREMQQLMVFCKKFGDKDPNLWMQALQFLAQQDDATDELGQMLQLIEERSLLPPVTIVSIVASNPNVKFGMLRGFLSRTLEATMDDVEESERMIQVYAKDTASTKERIARLRRRKHTYDILCILQNVVCQSVDAFIR